MPIYQGAGLPVYSGAGLPVYNAAGNTGYTAPSGHLLRAAADGDPNAVEAVSGQYNPALESVLNPLLNIGWVGPFKTYTTTIPLPGYEDLGIGQEILNQDLIIALPSRHAEPVITVWRRCASTVAGQALTPLWFPARVLRSARSLATSYTKGRTVSLHMTAKSASQSTTAARTPGFLHGFALQSLRDLPNLATVAGLQILTITPKDKSISNDTFGGVATIMSPDAVRTNLTIFESDQVDSSGTNWRIAGLGLGTYNCVTAGGTNVFWRSPFEEYVMNDRPITATFTWNGGNTQVTECTGSLVFYWVIATPGAQTGTVIEEVVDTMTKETLKLEMGHSFQRPGNDEPTMRLMAVGWRYTITNETQGTVREGAVEVMGYLDEGQFSTPYIIMPTSFDANSRITLRWEAAVQAVPNSVLQPDVSTSAPSTSSMTDGDIEAAAAAFDLNGPLKRVMSQAEYEHLINNQHAIVFGGGRDFRLPYRMAGAHSAANRNALQAAGFWDTLGGMVSDGMRALPAIAGAVGHLAPLFAAGPTKRVGMMAPAKAGGARKAKSESGADQEGEAPEAPKRERIRGTTGKPITKAKDKTPPVLIQNPTLAALLVQAEKNVRAGKAPLAPRSDGPGGSKNRPKRAPKPPPVDVDEEESEFDAEEARQYELDVSRYFPEDEEAEDEEDDEEGEEQADDAADSEEEGDDAEEEEEEMYEEPGDDEVEPEVRATIVTSDSATPVTLTKGDKKQKFEPRAVKVKQPKSKLDEAYQPVPLLGREITFGFGNTWQPSDQLTPAEAKAECDLNRNSHGLLKAMRAKGEKSRLAGNTIMAVDQQAGHMVVTGVTLYAGTVPVSNNDGPQQFVHTAVLANGEVQQNVHISTDFFSDADKQPAEFIAAQEQILRAAVFSGRPLLFFSVVGDIKLAGPSCGGIAAVTAAGASLRDLTISAGMDFGQGPSGELLPRTVLTPVGHTVEKLEHARNEQLRLILPWNEETTEMYAAQPDDPGSRYVVSALELLGLSPPENFSAVLCQTLEECIAVALQLAGTSIGQTMTPKALARKQIAADYERVKSVGKAFKVYIDGDAAYPMKLDWWKKHRLLSALDELTGKMRTAQSPAGFSLRKDLKKAISDGRADKAVSLARTAWAYAKARKNPKKRKAKPGAAKVNLRAPIVLPKATAPTARTTTRRRPAAPVRQRRP